MSLQGRKFQGKASKKQDIEETANKLRAIKERQGQWMRERQEAKAAIPFPSSKSVDNLGNRGKTSSTRSSSISDLSSNVESRGTSRSDTNKDRYSNPRRKPLYTAPKRDQSNIITWSGKGDGTRKAGRPPSAQRKQPSSTKFSNLDSGKSNSYMYTKSHTLGEKAYEPSNYTSVQNNSAKDLSTSSLHSKLQPISTGFSDESERSKLKFDKQSFDYEDSITSSMVMDDRHASNDKRPTIVSALPHEINTDMINALAEKVAKKLKTTIDTGNSFKNASGTSSMRGKYQEDDQEMSTHMCPLCHSLMSGTRHTPLALIPCGHTLCKECSRDCKKCPSCQSRVTSSAVNTVLQQIISDFLSQKERKRLEKMEKETRKYVDEYQSLSLRSNALTEEADIILNGMEDFTEHLFQEKKSFKRLEVDNEELKKKIFELQNLLDKNKVKMVESQERCENLESKYEDEKQRLALVEDTVKTITLSKERVKMLVHNFAPSFNLDQFG